MFHCLMETLSAFYFGKQPEMYRNGRNKWLIKHGKATTTCLCCYPINAEVWHWAVNLLWIKSLHVFYCAPFFVVLFFVDLNVKFSPNCTCIKLYFVSCTKIKSLELTELFHIVGHIFVPLRVCCCYLCFDFISAICSLFSNLFWNWMASLTRWQMCY